MLKLAVLLSGSGRTLDNFHNRIMAGSMDAKIMVVISNKEDALGLRKAVNYGYPSFHGKDNDEINRILNGYSLDLVVLAGYLRLYVPHRSLCRRVLNIHPSLIPSFCGAGFYGHLVHEAVKERGCLISGCTVHFADEKYDEGPIVLQKCVALEDTDDPDEIGDKVFLAECEAFPEAVNLVAEKGIDYFWKRRGGL
jgi:phosphoribosylglycinamide formyltransferase-1